MRNRKLSLDLLEQHVGDYKLHRGDIKMARQELLTEVQRKAFYELPEQIINRDAIRYYTLPILKLTSPEEKCTKLLFWEQYKTLA